MIEKWIRWEPIPDLAPKYITDSINFNKNCLHIVLMDEGQDNKLVEISFKKPIIAYTRTDESFTSELAHDLSVTYGTPFFAEWTLFKITNSKYIERLSKEYNCRKFDYSNSMHFSLLACDDVVDIISDYEPTVTMRTLDAKNLMLLYKEQLLPIILRYFPTAKIILYGSRSQGKIIKEGYGIENIKIALDTGHKIDPTLIKTLLESLRYEAAVRIPRKVVDLHAVSNEVREQILQEGIDWVKAKHI